MSEGLKVSLPTRPLIFAGGSKSPMSDLIAQQRSSLSCCGLESEQDLTAFYSVLQARIPMPELEHPLKTDGKSVIIINNSAVDWSISLKFDSYIDHMTLDLPHVQAQGVKGQGHSVT